MTDKNWIHFDIPESPWSEKMKAIARLNELVPDNEILAQIRIGGVTEVDALSEIFGVSPRLIVEKLINLKVIRR